ncbi:MAG: DUF971 domain-containing protein [Granulicella sp.]
MSHEGIRITSASNAEHGENEEVKLPADASTPQKVRVNKTAGTGVEIDWKDGHKSTWSFGWLRNACPCATCAEERSQTGRALGAGKPKTEMQQALAMYEAPIRPTEAIPAGKYAIKFKWSDGHQTGIYSWDYLRRVCQCPQCVSERVTK